MTHPLQLSQTPNIQELLFSRKLGRETKCHINLREPIHLFHNANEDGSADIQKTTVVLTGVLETGTLKYMEILSGQL